MAKEVADVVLLGARLEQTAGKLPAQIVEAQARDARPVAGGIPGRLDRFDWLTAFIAEDKG